MRIGNQLYSTLSDVPEVVPVFPLSGALLLPRADIKLNIFEPRYVQMVDEALATDRVIGMVQPRFDDAVGEDPARPPLCKVGALGRVITFQESGDGRYFIQLAGVCRFSILEEIDRPALYRTCRISAERFVADLDEETKSAGIDREGLIKAMESYLDANEMQADWNQVRSVPDEVLVNTFAMMTPYGPAEKQALLEAPDLASRAATLVAITEMELARQSGDKPVLN